MAVAFGCSSRGEGGAGSSEPAEQPAPSAAKHRPTPEEVEQKSTEDPEPLQTPVLRLVEGRGGEKQERWIERRDIEDAGYTVLDFGDDWTPFIFTNQHGEDGRLLPNRYRRVFLGLANDELDSDGRPLQEGEKNYLELYGIFPTFSVLRARALLDETRTCVVAEDQQAMRAVESVPFGTAWKMRRDRVRQQKAFESLEAKRRKAKVASLAELAEKVPKLAGDIASYQKWKARREAFSAAERRLACEGFLDLKAKGKRRHEKGVYDEALRIALRSFQQKHMIYEGHSLRPRTLAALARSTLENDYESFRRVFRERIMAAADVIEDGSTHGKGKAPTYVGADGKTHEMPNLAEELTELGLKQLALTSPEAMLAFFKHHPPEVLSKLLVAAKLPEPPEYYGSHMDLSVEVDRGDVYYDPPFDENDRWRHQARSRFPHLTLLVNYRGQRLPLVRWRTTIGGWRSEMAKNGYEYYKYKGSDVGERVMRKIIAGPVWIAPESTPLRAMVQSKKVHGRWQGMVNYDELGPGYTSAYGVVAGYFVIPGDGEEKPDVDRGIRAHGSSNYLSIYSNSGYSHGCHRLPNHLAVRLYDFVLQHRTMKVHGDDAMDFHRQFLWKDHVYEMRIPSRGYEFELDPPMPLEVLEGRIRGTLQEPVEGYVQKPGVRYPPPSEDPEEDLLDSASEGDIDAVTGASQRAAMRRAKRERLKREQEIGIR